MQPRRDAEPRRHRAPRLPTTGNPARQLEGSFAERFIVDVVTRLVKLRPPSIGIEGGLLAGAPRRGPRRALLAGRGGDRVGRPGWGVQGPASERRGNTLKRFKGFYLAVTVV